MAGLFGGDSLYFPYTSKMKRGFNTIQRVKFLVVFYVLLFVLNCPD